MDHRSGPGKPAGGVPELRATKPDAPTAPAAVERMIDHYRRASARNVAIKYGRRPLAHPDQGNALGNGCEYTPVRPNGPTVRPNGWRMGAGFDLWEWLARWAGYRHSCAVTQGVALGWTNKRPSAIRSKP